MSPLNRASHNVLNRHTARWFEGETLFARLGRTLCEAEALPRKEFFEAWESAKRIRRQMRGGEILEVAAGHGLLSAVLLILDDSSPGAVLVDPHKPASFEKIYEVLTGRWPRLRGRIEYRQEEVSPGLAHPDSLVVSVHACGALTDDVLQVALRARCRVAVVPCCHDLTTCDTGGLLNWMDGPLAVDAMRVARLRSAGYKTAAITIPADITPKNHLLLGWPGDE